MDPTYVQELKRLRERTALLPHDQPFQALEVVATLGVGGFGRVELVRHHKLGTRTCIDDISDSICPYKGISR